MVTISAGNSGGWADSAVSGAGHLYADDISMQTTGSPGSYTNSLGIASVDNDGATGGYFTVGSQSIVYNESTGFTNQPLTTLAGEQEYVLIDGIGAQEDWDAALEDVNLTGKILICARGSINFAAKAATAVENGAAGVMIYNNTSGIMAMDLTGYEDDAPCVSIRQADADVLRQNAQAYEHCYVGKLTVAQGAGTQVYNSAYYTMSDFSSWGVPGSLTLKPELTTPGGSIYSVNGAVAGGKSYELMSGTSMAAPQAAGMAALAAQYMADKGLTGKTGVSARALSQSLLMSTATPLLEEASGSYWSVLKQGAGLANIGDVVTAHSYVMMGKDATASWADGKVKAELGADAARAGSYTFSFTLSDLTGSARTYALNADLFTQGLLQDEDGVSYLDTATTALDAAAMFRVNGKTLTPGAAADFDGDGDVDTDDYTALVEYVAGKRTILNDLDRADYDGDGSITSYDAYLFLQDTAPSVTVPANGSVTWTSSNPAVASVNDSGIVTAVSQGSAVITATSNLDKSISGSCAVEVFTIDKTLNGVVWDKDETVYWASFNAAGLPGYTALSGAASVKPISAAYDENGVLYAADMSSDNTSTLYTIDPKTFQATAVGSSSQVFYTDMAQAPSLHQNVLAAVYGPYLLLVDKESGEYVGALCQYPNSLTGIAYCGSFYSTANKVWMDSYLLVDAAGNVYRQNICLYQGQPAYTHDGDTGLLVRNAARLNTYEYFSAAYYDGQYLYWSVVDQDSNCSNLYAIDVFHETVYPVGHFADDVWPVVGLMELGKTNPVTITESQAMAGAAGALHTDTVRVSPAAVTGSLNSVESCTRPQSALEPVTDALAVSLTAQNAQGPDVASHNGKLVVRYDSANLTLTGVQGAADYLAYADDGAGRLVIAYAGRESIPAGTPVATLTFSARNNAAGTVQVLHQKTDDALNGSFTETLTLGGDHSHLSLTYVPAQAASCEQDGHVEYWFCAACGRYFADAQAQKELTYAETVIPATGHSFTTVDAKAANCT